MSLQHILSKILSQAEAEAQNIVNEAQKKADNTSNEIAIEAKAEIVSLEAKAEEKIEHAFKKSESLAHMEGKNRVLAKKREFVESVLLAIVDSLASMPAKEYEQFLADILKNIDLDEGEIFPAKGKENSTKGAVKIAGKQLKVSESQNFKGGFIIKSSQEDINCTFENLVLHNLRKDLEAMIAENM